MSKKLSEQKSNKRNIEEIEEPLEDHQEKTPKKNEERRSIEEIEREEKELEIQLFELADQGNSIAQYNLGRYLENQLKFIDAFNYYKLAADQGHLAAQHYVGNCYQHGDGVTNDSEKAFYYHKLAADQGHLGSQFIVAYCYQHGYNVKKDSEKAFYYHKLAADQGNLDSQIYVGDYYSKQCDLRRTKEDGEKAFHYYKLAEKHQDARALTGLGFCYRLGRGVKADFATSFKYFSLSASKGNYHANYMLSCMDRSYSRIAATLHNQRVNFSKNFIEILIDQP